ncbi:hypothetical protein [Streptomyces gobiensis]|uniref:hypothetical protein n=1 Tax=Streptomyces gobiensis TaxID=2875706 RepID=UPI001E521947|nr:hypothetical protein [Streptomyces gobiensis]UGY91946.1 hypothetical protein test1122_09570 [Streptomyces gobiensis]
MEYALEYPVSLALEDFVPVVLTGVAAARLVKPIGRAAPRARTVAATGAALVFAGGLSKAGWKLTVALDGPDIQPLNKALFPLLALGFLLLAHALLSAPLTGDTPRARRSPPLWGFAVTWTAAAIGSLALRSTLPLMVLTIAAVTVCGVRLILLASSAGEPRAATATGLWLLGTYALGPLAARPDQSVALQWVEQSCNTLTQAALVYAAWRLSVSSPRKVTL